MSSRVILALGANLGRRRENLQQAVDSLGEVMAIEGISALYETEPWGVTDQPDFINLCLTARTSLEPGDVLTTIKEIAEQVRTQGLDVTALLVQGVTAETITVEASKLDVDIIVVGSHSRSAIQTLLVGNVTKGVLQKSEIPVLVVPTR